MPAAELADLRIATLLSRYLIGLSLSFQIMVIYKFLCEMHKEGKYKSSFLSSVETVLNGIGLCDRWTSISLT